jgi:hypothetical protein
MKNHVPAPTYEFEGQQLTCAEICKLVPRLSRSSILWHLRQGRMTRIAMLQFDPRAARRKTRLKNQRLWAQGAAV